MTRDEMIDAIAAGTLVCGGVGEFWDQGVPRQMIGDDMVEVAWGESLQTTHCPIDLLSAVDD